MSMGAVLAVPSLKDSLNTPRKQVRPDPPKMDSAGNGAQTGHGSAAERPRMAMRHAFLGAQRESMGLAAPQGHIYPHRPYSTPPLFASVEQGQALRTQPYLPRRALACL